MMTVHFELSNLFIVCTARLWCKTAQWRYRGQNGWFFGVIHRPNPIFGVSGRHKSRGQKPQQRRTFGRNPPGSPTIMGTQGGNSDVRHRCDDRVLDRCERGTGRRAVDGRERPKPRGCKCHGGRAAEGVAWAEVFPRPTMTKTGRAVSALRPCRRIRVPVFKPSAMAGEGGRAVATGATASS